MKNKNLIIVDMQVDFITGALANPNQEWAHTVIKNIFELLKKFDGRVWFTRDTHSMNYLETQEGKNLKVPHCIKGTPGWEIISEFRPWVNEHNVIDKNTFGFPYWGVVLGDHDTYSGIEIPPTEVYLAGTVTSICVDSNANGVKTAFPEAIVGVYKDCCLDVDKKHHEAALLAMSAKQIQIL
jgi:nicotinamidase-related amidase